MTACGNGGRVRVTVRCAHLFLPLRELHPIGVAGWAFRDSLRSNTEHETQIVPKFIFWSSKGALGPLGGRTSTSCFLAVPFGGRFSSLFRGAEEGPAGTRHDSDGGAAPEPGDTGKPGEQHLLKRRAR